MTEDTARACRWSVVNSNVEQQNKKPQNDEVILRYSKFLVRYSAVHQIRNPQSEIRNIFALCTLP
jgi:hypothetical protein